MYIDRGNAHLDKSFQDTTEQCAVLTLRRDDGKEIGMIGKSFTTSECILVRFSERMFPGLPSLNRRLYMCRELSEDIISLRFKHVIRSFVLLHFVLFQILIPASFQDIARIFEMS